MMEDAPEKWAHGDLEAGFKKADLVLDETFVTPDTSHQTLETRTAMAYWQNGKVHVHTGTQSTAQTVLGVARWAGVDPDNVVVVSEYTGGGFGSKITGAISLVIPVLLAKKANAPVMMRISREEEHYIGRATARRPRPNEGGVHEGRSHHSDRHVLRHRQRPVRAAGRYQQHGSDRVIDVPAGSDAVSRHRRADEHAAERAPESAGRHAVAHAHGADHLEGGAQARDRSGGDPAHQRAGREGVVWTARWTEKRETYITSAFVKEALDKGADLFKWDERKAQSAKKNGSKVRGVGVAVSTYSAGSVGYDGLFILKPDGKLYIQSGIGNHGTGSVSDCHRVSAELLGVPWEKVVVTFGDTSRNLPWTCPSGGSQTIHAMTRAAHAVGMDARKKLQEIAAKDLGGKPEDYDVANERVFRKGGGSGMSLAKAAQRAIDLGGAYDGHELPQELYKFTKASATALAGQGLMGVAKDKYPRDGQSRSFVAGFAEVEVDVETGKYHILDYLAVADVGTVIHPRNLGGQVLGRSMLGIGHTIGQKWVYDQHYGVALARRFHHNRPPTILDAPQRMEWAAVGIPDPETPVGARGIGEPPVGAGACAVLNALSDALGDEIFQRAPVTLDMILDALEAGRPTTEPLTAHI